MNDNGFGLVSKGVLTEAEATLSVFQQAGLNASVARCADVDAEIQRLAQKPSKANVTHDTYLQCSRWTLTGACARRPLFMHSRCIAHAMPMSMSMCHVPCTCMAACALEMQRASHRMRASCARAWHAAGMCRAALLVPRALKVLSTPLGVS